MEINIQKLIEEALLAGFSQAGELNVKTLKFMPEVREMCAADRCKSFGKNWTCPPYCGTLEEFSQKTALYTKGILVQTIEQLEDDFDYETMMSTMEVHKESFEQFKNILQSRYPKLFPMSAGACTICGECTCPDSPCRFPDRAVPSMEACGLFVSQVCTESKIPYNNGRNTVTYTSCFLLE